MLHLLLLHEAAAGTAAAAHRHLLNGGFDHRLLLYPRHVFCFSDGHGLTWFAHRRRGGANKDKLPRLI